MRLPSPWAPKRQVNDSTDTSDLCLAHVAAGCSSHTKLIERGSEQEHSDGCLVLRCSSSNRLLPGRARSAGEELLRKISLLGGTARSRAGKDGP